MLLKVIYIISGSSLNVKTYKYLSPDFLSLINLAGMP